MNATVGDLAGNAARVIDFAERARQRGAELLVTPELALCGYPPEALLLRDDFMARCSEALADIARRVRGITLLVGHPRLEHGRRHNSASVLCDGRALCAYDKNHLANYTVFDEERYFETSRRACVFGRNQVELGVSIPQASWHEVDGQTPEDARFGINICADAWHAEAPRRALDAGARILLVLNASPYHMHKQAMREKVMRQRVAETGLAIVYVNMVGGQDELVFDGASFVMNSEGEVTQQVPAFEETMELVELANGEPVSGRLAPRVSTEAEVYSALVVGVRDYVRKNEFSGAVVGLSGGIDSALTLAVAVDALGARKVRAVITRSQDTLAGNRNPARALAQMLGVRCCDIAIDPVFAACRAVLTDDLDGGDGKTAEQNLQSRVRGTLLAALAEKSGAVVLTAGNKSAADTGDATWFADMGGAFAVLKDVRKKLVYALARYRNAIGPVIPREIVDAAGADEPKGNDGEGAVPPHPILDAILEAYVDDEISPADIIALGHSRDDVDRVVRLVCASEYRRRQAPIGVRVTSRGLGKDARSPITNRFRHRY